MSKDGVVARQTDVKEEVFKARRRHVVRRFDQHIQRIRERQKTPFFQAGHEVRGDVIIGAWHHFERNAGLVEALLQQNNSLPDFGAGVWVHAWHDMGSAGDAHDALLRKSTSHRQACLKIGCSVIETWQQMTMKIEHRLSKQYEVTLDTSLWPFKALF